MTPQSSTLAWKIPWMEEKERVMIETRELLSKVFCLIVLYVEVHNWYQYITVEDGRREKKKRKIAKDCVALKSLNQKR